MLKRVLRIDINRNSVTHSMAFYGFLFGVLSHLSVIHLSLPLGLKFTAVVCIHSVISAIKIQHIRVYGTAEHTLFDYVFFFTRSLARRSHTSGENVRSFK